MVETQPRVENRRVGLWPSPCVARVVDPSHLSVMCRIGLHMKAMVLNLSGKVSWGLPFGGRHPQKLAIIVILESEECFERGKLNRT